MRTTHTSRSWKRDEQEQEDFARTVDNELCDVSDRTGLDRALRRELAVVAVLRQAGGTVGPVPEERDRMRQRVMAEFASVVHEGNSPVLPLVTARRRRWIPGEARGRLIVAAAAALCLLASLSGMSFLLSRDALPGDALYTVKRSAESAELGFTFGDQPKALKHLEFAGDRVSEIEIMANQADAAGTWSQGQAKFLRALDDFDSDATAGARLLTGLALGGKPASLPALRSWAEQQKARLAALRAALPLRISARLDSTLGLLDRVVTRASALSMRSACVTITSGTRDDLGLVPAKDTCKPTIPTDGNASVVPLPDVAAAPAASPPSAIMLPHLLLPAPSANPVPVPAQSGSSDHASLPSTGTTGGVLSNPNQSGAQPWRPLPGHGSPQPNPLPPWILRPQLLPPG
ncbi:MAG: DUF5667 domain-containing protein [Pseudonocardiaceae bacterium]